AVGLPTGERATALALRGDRLYLGGQACPSEALDGGDCPGRLYVYNLANPERPALAGQLDLPGTVIDIVPAEEYLYLAAGPAGVWAVDARDPARPTIAGHQDLSSGAQALAVVFNRVYVASGRGGLVVLQVSQE
ncbi:MAG TPA: hypothetical protein VI776_16145, partial [Anaerolineales bacterium]|nr:hypothetical protein [Anaerolineales bacterium]